MNPAFLPGFEVKDARSYAVPPDTAVSNVATNNKPAFIDRVTSNAQLYDRRWSDFASKVSRFTSSLSPEQRATVARRARFYSLPWIRRADEIDRDDVIPFLGNDHRQTPGPNFP